MNQPKIDVCLSPELLHLYDLSDTIVVVTDILRATSCMVTGFAHGVDKMIPVKEVEECKKLQLLGYVAAAERDGKKVEGFDLDNSPFSYMQSHLQGQIIAVTTTNGTLAIKSATTASQVLIGAFLNKQSIIEYLLTQKKDVLVICAGWKGKVNMEDSLFAGAVVEGLKNDFNVHNDAALISQILYNNSKDNMMKVIEKCSHVQRLRNLGIEEDILFCLTENHYNLIPVLEGDFLIKM